MKRKPAPPAKMLSPMAKTYADQADPSGSRLLGRKGKAPSLQKSPPKKEKKKANAFLLGKEEVLK